MILIREDEALIKKINKAVFPGLQGGPHMNNIAAKAVCFHEAQQPTFADYAVQVLKNAKAMEGVLREKNVRMIGGGTSNHLILADVYGSLHVSGKAAQTVLDEVGITVNMNAIADDVRKPLDPSGIRFGTPAMTTRGFKEEESNMVARIMLDALHHRESAHRKQELRKEVQDLCRSHPVPDSFM